MNTRLNIVIPAYNSLKWIRRTLNSVAMQSYRNYQVCVIDDASTQPGQQELIAHYCETHGWKSIYRQENRGALANIVEGIRQLSPSDEEVILLLDGDDWLFHKQVFSKIATEYASPSTLLTYGQFITYPRWQLGFCRPLSNETFVNFRKGSFLYSHLRTFRFKLWNAIDDQELRDSSGHYYRTAWDLAIMYPLLEMTGGLGCKYIEEILYVYNTDNPLNDCIAHRELQAATALEIINKTASKQKFFSEPIQYLPSTKVRLKNQWASLYKKVVTPRVYQLAWNKFWVHR